MSLKNEILNENEKMSPQTRTLNGAVIEQTEHYVMTETENSYSLRVEEAALSDAGLYKLKLSNLLGECAKSAPVTVHGNKQ